MLLAWLITSYFDKAQIHSLPLELRNAEKKTGIREVILLTSSFSWMTLSPLKFCGQ
jgi:hypothetical protein